MSISGISTRSQSAIFTSQKANIIDKGITLAKLASGKKDKARFFSGSVVFTENLYKKILDGSSTIEVNKIQQDIKRVDEMMTPIKQIAANYTWIHKWLTATDNKTKAHYRDHTFNDHTANDDLYILDSENVRPLTVAEKANRHYEKDLINPVMKAIDYIIYNIKLSNGEDLFNTKLSAAHKATPGRHGNERGKKLLTFNFYGDIKITSALLEYEDVSLRHRGLLENITRKNVDDIDVRMVTDKMRWDYFLSPPSYCTTPGIGYLSGVVNDLKNRSIKLITNLENTKTELQKMYDMASKFSEVLTKESGTGFFNTEPIHETLKQKKAFLQNSEVTLSRLNILNDSNKILYDNFTHMKNNLEKLAQHVSNNQDISEKEVNFLKDQSLLSANTIINTINSTDFSGEKLLLNEKFFLSIDSDDSTVSIHLVTDQINEITQTIKEHLPKYINNPSEAEFDIDTLLQLTYSALTRIQMQIDDTSVATEKLLNSKTLNTYEVQHLSTLIANIENIVVHDEMIDLMKEELLENLSSESAARLKEASTLILKVLRN